MTEPLSLAEFAINWLLVNDHTTQENLLELISVEYNEYISSFQETEK